MEYIHIKNIEKYQPGYTDRQHIWAKVYYKIFLNENFQELGEIDKYRLISLIVLEVYTQKPTALTSTNLTFLGWDKKKHPIPLTIKMLHTFIEVRNTQSKKLLLRVEENRVEENRIDETKHASVCIDKASEWYASLQTDFPLVDIDAQLKRAMLWEKDNPRKNHKKFFRNWLLNCKTKPKEPSPYAEL